MLLKQELISDDIAQQLLQGIQSVRSTGVDGIDLNPQFEDAYFAFENALSERIGASVTGWIHVGRSRNDLGATLDRVQSKSLTERYAKLGDLWIVLSHVSIKTSEDQSGATLPMCRD